MWPFKEIEKENKGLGELKRDINSLIKQEMRNIGKAGFSRPKLDLTIKGFGRNFSQSQSITFLFNNLLIRIG